ncbi:TPA: hypothetical protein ACOJPC_000318 [Vibrio fluvialis]
MNNSHISKNILLLRQKFLVLCCVFVAVIIGLSIANIFLYGFNWLNLVVPVFTVGFAFYAYRDQIRPIMVLGRICDALEEAKQGNIHVRITQTKGLGEVGQVAWALNDFLDIVETNFKELSKPTSKSCRTAFSALRKSNFIVMVYPTVCRANLPRRWTTSTLQFGRCTMLISFRLRIV